MGYRTGKLGFHFPAPHEVDLIICDLKRPACFDRKNWGPNGGNDNFRCKIIPQEELNNTFYVTNNRRHAQHTLVYKSQLGKPIPGSFGPKDVNRAILEGGIPLLVFLNQEWVSRAEEFPNWVDIDWSFLPTSATQVEIHDFLKNVLPELGQEIKFRFAIQHKIEKGPLFESNFPRHLMSVTSIVKNKVGDVFGQLVRMGKGTAWLIPGTHQNVDIVQLFASRLDAADKVAPLQPRQPVSTYEAVYGSAYDVARKKIAEGRIKPVSHVAATSPVNPAGNNKIELFISHSHADVEVATELINLLRSAIQNLAHDAIRCTSVPGYQLEAGARTEDHLLAELLGAKVFIGLLSKQSLESTYVLFELGARWGAQKHLIPLLVAGMKASELRAPLSSLHAISAAVEAQIHDLLVQIASQLGLLLTKPSVYEGQVKKLMRISDGGQSLLSKSKSTPS